MSKAMGEALGRLEAVVHDRLAAGEAAASYVASLARCEPVARDGRRRLVVHAGRG